jgi:hypothetical protein
MFRALDTYKSIRSDSDLERDDFHRSPKEKTIRIERFLYGPKYI